MDSKAFVFVRRCGAIVMLLLCEPQLWNINLTSSLSPHFSLYETF